jgi:tRNA threonylcarbamoyladenosine biosynthesis protein TsaB
LKSQIFPEEVAMIILAFDSTAAIASVAVHNSEKMLGEYRIDNGLTQSELLLPMADSLLKSLRMDYSEIGLVTCTVGPGSFTGVRIGAAVVKGLAFGKDIPCVEVSTLEALAENLVPLRGVYAPCMDARRGQVYNALFGYENGEMKRLTPDRAIAIDELGEELKKYGEPIYISGDGYGNVKHRLDELGVKTEDTPEWLILQNAASVARVALRLYRDGKAVSDKELAPTYLRLPQAERERLERLGQKTEG